MFCRFGISDFFHFGPRAAAPWQQQQQQRREWGLSAASGAASRLQRENELCRGRESPLGREGSKRRQLDRKMGCTDNPTAAATTTAAARQGTRIRSKPREKLQDQRTVSCQVQIITPKTLNHSQSQYLEKMYDALFFPLCAAV